MPDQIELEAKLLAQGVGAVANDVVSGLVNLREQLQMDMSVSYPLPVYVAQVSF